MDLGDNLYNADIDISKFKIIDENSLNDIDVEYFTKYKDIPDEFNWSISFKGDDVDIISKKKLISPVKNQHLCGCCWAISVATAISDCFVVKGLVDWMPNVSFTYALSKYPQQKCIGGSSRVLLEDIKHGDGIASDYCVDDNWCKINEKCVSGDASKHFMSGDKEYLSSLIPKEGCYNGDKKHYVYNIGDVYSLTTSNNLKIIETQTKIKQHIMIRGPVVAGFLIMKNFPDGKFTKQGNGIYLENIKPPPKNSIYNIEEDINILGSHSVVVVGWGVSRNQKYNNLTIDIPYWYCRNSWGDNWGENGYFKLGMYPFNKICQLSKKIRVIHENSIKEVGGVTGFNVINPPILKFLKTNNYNLKNFKNLEKFSLDENFLVYSKIIKDINDSEHLSETQNINIIYILGIIIISFLLNI